MKHLALFIILISLNSTAQEELSCLDFKENGFYVAHLHDLNQYHSEHQDKASLSQNDFAKKAVHIMIKRDYFTTKKSVKNRNKKPDSEIVSWMDDCSYILTFDEKKTDLSYVQKWVNNNGGIQITLNETSKKCVSFDAEMKTNLSQKIYLEGSVCLQ